MGRSIFIFLFLTLLFIIIGVLIKHFKCYWLIAGYNTASDEEKKKVDVVGLSRLMGNFCFFLGGLFFILGILGYYGSDIGTIAIYPLIFASIIYLIIKAQKYDTNIKSSKVSKITAIIIGSFFIVTSSMILWSARETRVIVTQQAIEIKDIYGENLEMDHISEIVLKDSMPRVYAKANGFDFGKTLKGNFDLEELGTSKIYIYYGRPPYIYIKYDDNYIILNQKNEERTKKLYDIMIKQWRKE